MARSKTALVLGATGGIGGTLAAALQQDGWAIRALVRDPVKARTTWRHREQLDDWIAGDAMNERDVVSAADGVDAIVHAVNPPGYRDWDRLVLPMIANTIAAAKTAGGARIVLPGTIYNFDPQVVSVIDTDSPQQPKTRKGAIRVQLERMLAEAAPRAPTLVVRAGDFFGPAARSSWFSQSLVRAGRPVRGLVNPSMGPGHTWAYLPDLAEATVRLMNAEDRLLPFECLQFEGFYDGDGAGMLSAIQRVIGREVPVRRFPWWLMRMLAPFGGFPREAVEIEAHWRHPVRLDNRRLVELLGEEPRTQIDTAISATLEGLGCLDGVLKAPTLGREASLGR